MRFKAFLLVLALSLNAPARAADTGNAKVMILGVAHLVAKHDVHNSVFKDSPLSRERQAQIEQIIVRLAQFKPTKVLLEARMGDPIFASRYQQFLAGNFMLPGNEIYQFGFRLAARAANSAIYPIDTTGPTLIDETTPAGQRIDEFLKRHFDTVSDSQFSAFLSRTDALEREGTYLDLLRYLNSEQAVRANASLYSVLDGMGREADNAGSAYVSQWYARNCYIFSNILSVVEPGDRAVVIIGQGHEYLLGEFVRMNPTLTYVDPLDYLNK